MLEFGACFLLPDPSARPIMESMNLAWPVGQNERFFGVAVKVTGRSKPIIRMLDNVVRAGTPSGGELIKAMSASDSCCPGHPSSGSDGDNHKTSGGTRKGSPQ
jgi:hypothetical protein